MMTRFTVKYADPALLTFVVTADYHRVEGGALIFRNNGRRGGYPETVHVFAPGIWAEVTVPPQDREAARFSQLEYETRHD